MKYFNLLILLGVFIFVGCSEKEDLDIDENKETEIDVYSFRKDIIVEDSNGINTATYAVYSDDEILLEGFISNHLFELVVGSCMLNQVLEQSELKKSEVNDRISNEEDFLINQEPRIVLERIYEDIEDGDFPYTLLINSKPTALKYYSINYAVGYETTRGQVGVVHTGSGNPFMVNFRFKTKWYHSWSNLKTNDNGEAIKYVYDKPPINYSWFNWRDVHKRQVVVFPHINQGAFVNYVFVDRTYKLEELVTRSEK